MSFNAIQKIMQRRLTAHCCEAGADGRGEGWEIPRRLAVTREFIGKT